MFRQMKHLEKELEKSVWEIIIDLQREIRELEEENRKLKEENKILKELIRKAKEFEYDEDGMDYIWQNTKEL